MKSLFTSENSFDQKHQLSIYSFHLNFNDICTVPTFINSNAYKLPSKLGYVLTYYKIYSSIKWFQYGTFRAYFKFKGNSGANYLKLMKYHKKTMLNFQVRI